VDARLADSWHSRRHPARVPAVNAAAQGKEYPSVTVRVTPERVAAFAHAVGATQAGVNGVPPTFATVAEFASFPAIIADPELDLDFAAVLHGEQSFEWHRPFVIGDTITVTSRIAQIRQRGPLGFCTIESELRDADDLVVATARCTFLERGEAP